MTDGEIQNQNNGEDGSTHPSSFIFHPLHPWDVSIEEAAKIQSSLRSKVIKTNSFGPGEIKTVAGIDCSLKEKGRAAVVVLSFPELEVVDRAYASKELTFPYVPGYLSFRETPVVLEALAKLKQLPDLIMVDGQGYSHPRRFGIACHIGLFTDRPSIGCAKSILTGHHDELGPNPGDTAPLKNRGEVIGMAVRSKVRTNPLIVSIGHKIDLPTSVDFVLKCLRGYRLPETTRAAHNFAGSVLPDQEDAPPLEVAQPKPDSMTQGTLF